MPAYAFERSAGVVSWVFLRPLPPSPVSFLFFFFLSTDLFSVTGVQRCCRGWGAGRESHWGGLPPQAGVYV